jgi:transcription termination factor Rho
MCLNPKKTVWIEDRETVTGAVRITKEGEKYFPLIK